MRRILVAAAALLAPAFVFGQVMADRVPADAWFYIGFKGSAALQDQYATSHLRPVLESTGLAQLVSDRFHERFADAFNNEMPELADAWPQVVTAAKSMWQHPTAMWVGRGERGRPGFGIASDAGDGAPALLQQIRAAAKAVPELQVQQIGNVVVLSHGVVMGNFAPNDRSLGRMESFRSAMQQVDARGAFLGFVNLAAIYAANLNPEQRRMLDGLGLAGMNAVAFSGDFSGEDWRTRAFIPMTGEPRGLASLLVGEALTDDAIKLVPRSAATATVASIDLQRLYNETRETYGRLVPNGLQQFDQVVGMINSNLGMELQTEVLPHLGTEWVTYTDGSIGGTQGFGTVMVARLKDPAKGTQALTRLQQKLLTYARAGAETKQMRIPLIVSDYKGMKIQTIGLPLVSPSWAVRDGALYVALFPQPVMAAADYVASGGPSLLDAPVVAAWRKQHNGNPSGISYTDLPQVSRNGYGMMMLLSRYIGMMDLTLGVETPVVMVPPLSIIAQHGTPTMRATWADDAGWHLVTVEPFPGAQVMGTLMTADVSAAQAPLMVSILLPSLARAREKANQVKCASNLRQIGMACMLYAQDSRGKYPDSFGQVVATQQISPEVFLCPSRFSVPLPKGASAEEASAWVEENAQYEYLGKGLTSRDNSESVLAYERIDAHAEEGGNVLFLDGHVEWVPADRWDEVITEGLNQQ